MVSSYQVTTIGIISASELILNLCLAMGFNLKNFSNSLARMFCSRAAILSPPFLYLPLFHSLQSTTKIKLFFAATMSISNLLLVLNLKFGNELNPFTENISRTKLSKSFQSILPTKSSIVRPSLRNCSTFSSFMQIS